MQAWQRVLTEYGLTTALSFAALSFAFWVFRVGLQNPMKSMSDLMQESERLRSAYIEEIKRKDEELVLLKEEVNMLKQLNQELAAKCDALSGQDIA